MPCIIKQLSLPSDFGARAGFVAKALLHLEDMYDAFCESKWVSCKNESVDATYGTNIELIDNP